MIVFFYADIIHLTTLIKSWLGECKKSVRAKQTSLKGFSASKCDVGNWIFFRSSLRFLLKLICLSRFCLNGEGRRTQFQSLEVQEASSLHSKTGNPYFQSFSNKLIFLNGSRSYSIYIVHQLGIKFHTWKWREICFKHFFPVYQQLKKLFLAWGYIYTLNIPLNRHHLSTPP